jgi:tetratricopeptide (TPR) repeat protein
VVTIRTYTNAAEAAIAKSLLDSHDIFSRLADENVNLYGGGPLAMPIRLLVAEDQAQEAMRILETKGPELPKDFDPSAPVEIPNNKESGNEQILSELRRLRHSGQWILVIGVTLLAIVLYLVFKIPRDTDPWLRVQQAIQRHEYERALGLTREIVNERPDNNYGHEYLGYIYSRMGKLDQAELEYSRAYELSVKDLKEKLEAIRKRRDREAHIQRTVTPLTSPPSVP